jgi:hexosaminidase
MPRKNSSAICLFSALAAMAMQARGGPLPLDVMPAPADVLVKQGLFPIKGLLMVGVSDGSNRGVANAIARVQSRWLVLTTPYPTKETVTTGYKLVVQWSEKGAAVPSLGDDESYALELGPTQATLKSTTPLGAMHGLETFLQLPVREPGGWYLPQVTIDDRPRFPWRGLMIDVARHWQPIEVIERNLDAMAVVKLNVLHLHLTDDQGFRIESLTHPELQGMGSDGQYFTQAQMRTIIAYAAIRGIRVVPEFDIPGHATSWVVSHPEVASLPGPYSIERHWGVFNPVLDPTNEATYALLGDFLGEMAALFPDPFIHIGGDENNGVQWNANPKIQAFIREHGLKDNAGLHAYFNKRIREILAKGGKRIVGWDEIINPELPRDCVIDSWRGTEALGAAATMGFDGLLSNGFYIDLCYPASDHYLPDPIPSASKLTDAERVHVLGGEATMWSEFVSPETIDSRIWPRTTAVAERLWSPAGVRDVPEMYRRLAIVSGRISEAGSLHERNGDLMLRHLVGANLEIAGMDSLRTFISVIEPVKHYDRGGQQVWMNQQVPLIGIADAAKPESEVSRLFAAQVDEALFAPGTIDKARLGALLGTLSQWGAAGLEVADKLPGTYPALREAIPHAQGLAAATAAAADAIASLLSGTALPPKKASEAVAKLDAAAQPDVSATLIPSLGPMRLLVAAAEIQERRADLSDEHWKDQVIAVAYPGLAEAAPKPSS